MKLSWCHQHQNKQWSKVSKKQGYKWLHTDTVLGIIRSTSRPKVLDWIFHAPKDCCHFLQTLDMTENIYEIRDAIRDIWGPRTPYQHEWPTRCDVHTVDTPDKWVQSACVLCRYLQLCFPVSWRKLKAISQHSNGCGMDIGVKDGKVVGVRGRTTDRVNKGRLGPKGLNG